MTRMTALIRDISHEVYGEMEGLSRHPT